jgi:hypothetical protein
MNVHKSPELSVDGGNVPPGGSADREGVIMKGSAQAALAIGVGYVLGRRRKMRLATMLAVGAATGGLGKLGPVALKRAGKLLNSTEIAGALGPQVMEIMSTVRGDLLDAGKAAASAAVTSKVDSLSDSLHDRADALRNPQAAVADAGETVRGETVGRLRRRGRASDRDQAGMDEGDRGGGRSRRRASTSARSESDEFQEPEDYEDYQDSEDEPAEDEIDESPADGTADMDEEDLEEPAPRRRRTSRSPVSRTAR